MRRLVVIDSRASRCNKTDDPKHYMISANRFGSYHESCGCRAPNIKLIGATTVTTSVTRQRRAAARRRAV